MSDPRYKIPGTPDVALTRGLVHIFDTNRAMGLWVAAEDIDGLIAKLQAARDELSGREEA